MSDRAFIRESALLWAYKIAPDTSLSSVQKGHITVLADELRDAERRVSDLTAERDAFSLKYSRAVHDLDAADKNLRSRWQPLFDDLNALDDDDLAYLVHTLAPSSKRRLRKLLGLPVLEDFVADLSEENPATNSASPTA